MCHAVTLEACESKARVGKGVWGLNQSMARQGHRINALTGWKRIEHVLASWRRLTVNAGGFILW